MMVNIPFQKDYAEAYDFLYQDKNYESECDLIEEIFRKFASAKIRTILDLGCGTGSHAIPLAQRGYRVTGVDLAEDMLQQARLKAHSLPTGQLAFLLEDLRRLSLPDQYDAVLMMFAVLGYSTTNEDILAALNSVSRHLKPGGLFICDVWYGPAVLRQRPEAKEKTIRTGQSEIIRNASGTLDIFRHLCEVRYRLRHLQDGQVLQEAEERHIMRYFFPQELAFFIRQAAMEQIHISSFEDLARSPAEDTWNVLVAARRL
ncbi:Methyltransferase domain-containing protein [Syntrophus gentianae]|uniref:Methyltransferase domain-containing protein n=1 Tax=Syntrophus gentianae TaxID=43775 RepID=A0A1H7WAA7_9BACT|nr:class I SAM-dependent methyltransferase [Syntrophus gentianae]SEM17857.1 Methyltransferase domain-containing protein [Syntrophus gentianae]